MILTLVQDQAITARMAAIAGPVTFDRLFIGIRFHAVEADIVYVYAQNEAIAAEMEDNFAFQISVVAAEILKREINNVFVLSKDLFQ